MILLYHKVALSSPTVWWVSADDFNLQMAGLADRKVVPLEAYDPANPTHVVITFDGVYANILHHAVPILKKWGYPFELFVVGNYIGQPNDFDISEPNARFATIEELQAMVAAGGRVQWHTANHCRLAGTSDDLASELNVPEALRQAFPNPHLNWFAYPHGSNDPDVVKAVRQRFAGAVACGDGLSSDVHRLPRKEMLPGMPTKRSSVSVIIPNYNYGAFLEEAILSALRQSVPPDEILVIDDCSKDDSRAVMERYAGKVRLCVNESNLGIVENFRKAVSLSTGDYVAFLGADNRFRSDYVEKCKAALDAQPDAAVAYPDISLFGPFARMLAAQLASNPRFRIQRVFADPTTGEETYHWQFPDPSERMVELMKTGNCIHGSAMFRRSVYEDVGGYRAVQGMPEDRVFFSRIVEAGYPVIRVPHPLLDYRQHSPVQANTRLSTELQLAARSAELAGLRQELAKCQRENKALNLALEAAKLQQEGVIKLWDIEGRRQKWESTVAAGRRLFDEHRLHIHPNSDVHTPATLTMEIDAEGHTVFRSTVALLSKNARAVRFKVIVTAEGGPLHQAETILNGGEEGVLIMPFPPIIGPCKVTLLTEMANVGEPTSNAWACFDHAVICLK